MSSKTELICALPTPFLPDSAEIDYKAVEKLVAHLAQATPSALLAAGSTGEVHSLSPQEQSSLIEKLDESIKKVYAQSEAPPPDIFAGLFHTHLHPAIAQAEQIADQGIAKALMVITPYYIKPTQKELLTFFLTLADKSALPIYLYNNPGRTGVELEMDTLSTLARHPNIVGIKESALSTQRMRQLAKIPSLPFYCGNDDQIPNAMQEGAQGAVSALAPLAPLAFKEVLSGDDTQGAKELLALLPQLVQYPNPQLLKTLAARLHLMHPVLRAPLQTLDLKEEKLALLASAIEKLHKTN